MISAPTRNFAVHAVGAAISRPVQELPTSYKPVPLYRLPLRGRHAEVVVPYDRGLRSRRRGGYQPPGVGTTECVQARSFIPSAASRTARPVVVPYDHGTHPTVGRDDSARRCRNYRLRTNLFPCTVCRCADGTPRSSCPTTVDCALAVGRDDSARRCRNCRVRTDPEAGDCHVAALLAMTRKGCPACHCETPTGSWQSRAHTPKNHRPTKGFMAMTKWAVDPFLIVRSTPQSFTLSP